MSLKDLVIPTVKIKKKFTTLKIIECPHCKKESCVKRDRMIVFTNLKETIRIMKKELLKRAYFAEKRIERRDKRIRRLLETNPEIKLRHFRFFDRQYTFWFKFKKHIRLEDLLTPKSLFRRIF